MTGLEGVRAAIRRLDAPRTLAELRACEAAGGGGPWLEAVAGYVRRRLWAPADGTGAATGLAVAPLQQVLRWLLREEIEAATRLFAAGRYRQTRRVCEEAARIDGQCAPLALLRGLAMAHDEPGDWPTLLEARRWLTVAATDPALRDECGRAAEWLDGLLRRREQVAVGRLTDSYAGIRRVYDRPVLHYVEAVNMRASLVALGGKVRRARERCRSGTPAARSLELLARAVARDVDRLRVGLGL